MYFNYDSSPEFVDLIKRELYDTKSTKDDDEESNIMVNIFELFIMDGAEALLMSSALAVSTALLI